MRSAGYCDKCQRNVYLDDWACNAGHDRSHVSGWYNGDTGEPLTPPWLEQQQPSVASVPIPQPIDPAGAILELVARRATASRLTVLPDHAGLSITRGDTYEALVTASGTQLTMWEHLSDGADPCLRDLVRDTAREAGWSVRVALRRPVSSG